MNPRITGPGFTGGRFTRRFTRLAESLLRPLLPGRGRHRGPTASPTSLVSSISSASPASRPLAAHPASDVGPPAGAHRLRGEDNDLVRPYLVAHERREEARRLRARRRALWFAVHGIDVEPRLTHGVEVTA
jgi:hypothetical protein